MNGGGAEGEVPRRTAKLTRELLVSSQGQRECRRVTGTQDAESVLDH